MIPSELLARDPVDQFDRRWTDRGYHRASVREQLAPVPWKDGVTIGELLDRRCRSSRYGMRCERELNHIGVHNADSGVLQWGGA